MGHRHNLGNWKGWAMKVPTFWAQTALALLELFQGPKNLQLSWPNPSNSPRNVFALHQNHTAPRHIINRFINSYYCFDSFSKDTKKHLVPSVIKFFHILFPIINCLLYLLSFGPLLVIFEYFVTILQQNLLIQDLT